MESSWWMPWVRRLHFEGWTPVMVSVRCVSQVYLLMVKVCYLRPVTGRCQTSTWLQQCYNRCCEIKASTIAVRASELIAYLIFGHEPQCLSNPSDPQRICHAEATVTNLSCFSWYDFCRRYIDFRSVRLPNSPRKLRNLMTDHSNVASLCWTLRVASAFYTIWV